MNSKDKILIVEDETIIALDLKKYVERTFKIPVVMVNSAVDAVMTVKEVRPVLILMDIMLKGKLNGIDAAEIITTQYKIPIIYLTALGDSKTYESAEKTNPAKILNKPYEQYELTEAINSVLMVKTSS